MGGSHWLVINHSMDTDALSPVPCAPLVWSGFLAISPGRQASWWKERSTVFDEICLPVHISVLLHQIQSIGKGDLQGQEEGDSGSGFITGNKQLDLWQLRGQHGNLLASR